MARLTETEQQEIIRMPKDMSLRDGALPLKQSPAKQETASSLAVTEEYKEVWTGDFIFENDTMTIVEVTI